MPKKGIPSILLDWTDEFSATLLNTNSLYIALFSTSKKLLFANNSMSALFKNEPKDSFINPTFDEILLLNNSVSLIFEGFLSLGDYSSINISISAKIYRKKEQLLIVGGVNAAQLFEQNETMHQLNREITNLQRELIREKHALEKASKQLSKTNDELSELNTNKNRFISILSHDLKNPFNSLLGFSNLLLKNLHKYDIQKIEYQLKTINQIAYETYNLLEDLLFWSKSQSKKLAFNLQKIMFGEVCNKIISNLI